MKWIFFCIMMFALFGCADELEQYTQKQAAVVVCGHNKTYSKDEELQIFAEKTKLPPNAMLRAVLFDWEGMRIENRACQGKK